MKRTMIAVAGACLLAGAAAAQEPGGQHDHQEHAPSAAKSADWTALPMIRASRAGRSAARIALSGLRADQLKVLAPGGESWIEPVDGTGAARLTMRKDGNYHWLIAREETAEAVRAASAAAYFSNPGPAPAKMLARPAGGLEIVPAPLPREHRHYRAKETWPFLLRFDGQPVPGAMLTLETANGTRLSKPTDATGRVEITFPDDFAPERARGTDRHGRPPAAEFVVSARHAANGRQYLTAFNDRYSPDAFAAKSVWPGIAFLGLGMVAAAPLLRRRREG